MQDVRTTDHPQLRVDNDFSGYWGAERYYRQGDWGDPDYFSARARRIAPDVSALVAAATARYLIRRRSEKTVVYYD